MLVPALIAAGSAVYAGYLNDRTGVEKHLQETSRALSLVVDRQFGQAEALLWALSTSSQLRVKDYLAFDARARAAIRIPGTWVVVEDERGQVVNTLLPPGNALPVLSSRDHWKGAAEGTVRISNLFTGLVAKRPAVGVDTLITTADGSRLFVSVVTRADTMSQILIDQSLPQDWIGAILDRNGTVVARNKDSDRFVGHPATPENVRRVQAGVSQGVWEGISLDGVPTVVALSRSPSSGWSTIVAVPQAEITGPAGRTALYLAATGAMLLASGTLIAWRVGRSIAAPIERLALDAEALGRGAPLVARRSGVAEVDRVAGTLSSASAELRKREAALRASEERLRATQENAPVAIAEIGSDGRFLSVNEARCRLTGHTKDELIGQHFAHVTTEGSLDEDLALFAKHVSGELDAYTTESEFKLKDGRRGWARVTSTAIRNDHGTFRYAVRVVEDITERRAAERRQKLMINELNHRVKNTLAVVQSIAAQSFKGELDPKMALRAFQGRLLALSEAHNLLTLENWEAAPLERIVENALRPFAGGNRFETEGPMVRVGPKAAVALALAFHELCTNASKYGALSTEEGRVRIAWFLEGELRDVLHLRWEEIGGPEVQAPTRSGFGSRLIGRKLAAEFEGAVELRFPVSGAVCEITAPLAIIESR
ncbi:hypothetical protein GCM10011390_22280 [Aureimonas endophytica]|uniref:Blue-light-activated histidine kinase n=1 Tax=Aureimonas endophytica TaxID=2027858 RepID=A0A916ZL39_9HYPH|nr:hypothetical protein GCM10011390_22280 [Aureimonas endophytica]